MWSSDWHIVICKLSFANLRRVRQVGSNFLNDKDGIQQVDMVGFVINSSVPDDLSPLQFYIYSSSIEIFGNDVKKNINFLLTSAESEDPFLWSDVVDCKLVTCGPFREHEQNRHKFNSSAILSSKLQSDSNCFDEWIKNMAKRRILPIWNKVTMKIIDWLRRGLDYWSECKRTWPNW